MKLSLTYSIDQTRQITLVQATDTDIDLCSDGAPILRLSGNGPVTLWPGAANQGFAGATPDGHLATQNG